MFCPLVAMKITQDGQLGFGKLCHHLWSYSWILHGWMINLPRTLMETALAVSEAEEDPCRAEAVTLHSAEINLAPFHAYLADLPDCENECFLCAWLIFACICSLI